MADGSLPAILCTGRDMSAFEKLKEKYLNRATFSYFGTEAVYRRGDESVALTVKRNAASARLIGSEQQLAVDEERFKVLASALDFGSGAVTPEAGDRIELTAGGVFQLMPAQQPIAVGHGAGREWRLIMVRITA